MPLTASAQPSSCIALYASLSLCLSLQRATLLHYIYLGTRLLAFSLPLVCSLFPRFLLDLSYHRFLSVFVLSLVLFMVICFVLLQRSVSRSLVFSLSVRFSVFQSVFLVIKRCCVLFRCVEGVTDTSSPLFSCFPPRYYITFCVLISMFLSF